MKLHAIAAAAALAVSLHANAVDLSFSAPIQHSKSWFALADCGDFPGMSSAPENVNMTMHGTLSFDLTAASGVFGGPVRAGAPFWLFDGIVLTSDRTHDSPPSYHTTVTGIAGAGFVNVLIDFESWAEYEDVALTLPIAQPVPEPSTLALMGLGLLAAGRLTRKA